MSRFRSVTRAAATLSMLLIAIVMIAACSDSDGTGADDTGAESDNGAGETVSDSSSDDQSAESEDAETEEGRIAIDGSSTVYPITQPMAEEFSLDREGVQIPVGVSGTGGGFEKFCAGETDISDASRPIKPEEAEVCAENGIEYVELPIAFDGLSVVVNPENDWAECLTVDHLNTIWDPASEDEITNWNQVDDSFPDAPLELYGPGTDSGTYDYFTSVINGEEGASRGDFQGSEDDNVLVQGVAGDQNALGFFGYAYYLENEDMLSLVGIDNGDGCVQPSPETIEDGSYQPLSRPVFIYVNADALDRPLVEEFVDFYLTDGQEIIPEVGYIPLPEDLYTALQERVDSRTTGSVFEGGSVEGVQVEDLLFSDET